MSGPYRFIRHPIYTTVLLLVWSSVMGHPSLTTLIVSLLMTIVTIIRVVTEEQFLRERYPDYPEYARATRRMIPFLF
jgi:protein-S-isoprenylcysteine O-methyltransferase Ste14